MQPDYQKREAKQCLWDNDGSHTPKHSRNRGKARGKDKQLIKSEVEKLYAWDDEERQYQYFKEIEESLYCHYYGPCDYCKEGCK